MQQMTEDGSSFDRGRLEAYLSNIPDLHTWDGGENWCSGGFEANHLQRLFDFLKTHQCRRIVETGAGNSTLTFLLAQPERLVSIAPDPALFDRIAAYCAKHGIADHALERHLDGSQWALPRMIAAGTLADFDFALIDGAHGWPYVFVDFFYMHALLRQGGHIMLDDKPLHSVGELIRWLNEQPGYSVALDLGKAIVYRKDAAGAEFPEWNGQPYIARLSR
jgi:hypothetical protein